MKRNVEISRRIKELREERGMSKSELARQCDVTTTAVWNWEENGIVPRFDTFQLLAKALGKSDSYLRTGTDIPSSSGRAGDTSPRSVAVIIENARTAISESTGVPLDKVRLNVEFASN